MRIPMLALMFCLTIIGRADDARFIRLYDSGKYKEAAGELETVSLTNPLVASRVGAMYYSGLGVMPDKERGKQYLEKAMLAKNARAAINLAKIFYKFEHNLPKASWCLHVADDLQDTAVSDDVANMREKLGDQYAKGMILYVEQLRGQLRDEIELAKRRTGELEKEIAELKASRQQLEGIIVCLSNELASVTSDLVHITKAYGQITNDLDVTTAKLTHATNDLFKATHDHETAIKDLGKKLDTSESTVERYKGIIDGMKALPMGVDHGKVKIGRDEIYNRYNELVNRYNELVRKYNKLLELSGRK